jgi:hypothetical protein
MLALADRLLQCRSLLVDLVRSVPALTRIDEMGFSCCGVRACSGSGNCLQWVLSEVRWLDTFTGSF